MGAGKGGRTNGGERGETEFTFPRMTHAHIRTLWGKKR